MTNAHSARTWFLEIAKDENHIKKTFCRFEHGQRGGRGEKVGKNFGKSEFTGKKNHCFFEFLGLGVRRGTGWVNFPRFFGEAPPR